MRWDVWQLSQNRHVCSGSPKYAAQPAECKVTKFSHPFVKGDNRERNQMADWRHSKYSLHISLSVGMRLRQKQVVQHLSYTEVAEASEGNCTTLDVLVDTVQTKLNGMLMVRLMCMRQRYKLYFLAAYEITNHLFHLSRTRGKPGTIVLFFAAS